MPRQLRIEYPEGVYHGRIQPLQAGSKPSIDAVDRRDDLPPALGADCPSPIHQIRFLNGVEQITLAQCRPIEAVVRVKNHLVGFRLSGGPARGAY
jgi:hypothetical protein